MAQRRAAARARRRARASAAQRARWCPGCSTSVHRRGACRGAGARASRVGGAAPRRTRCSRRGRKGLRAPSLRLSALVARQNGHSNAPRREPRPPRSDLCAQRGRRGQRLLVCGLRHESVQSSLRLARGAGGDVRLTSSTSSKAGAAAPPAAAAASAKRASSSLGVSRRCAARASKACWRAEARRSLRFEDKWRDNPQTATPFPGREEPDQRGRNRAWLIYVFALATREDFLAHFDLPGKSTGSFPFRVVGTAFGPLDGRACFPRRPTATIVIQGLLVRSSKKSGGPTPPGDRDRRLGASHAPARSPLGPLVRRCTAWIWAPDRRGRHPGLPDEDRHEQRRSHAPGRPRSTTPRCSHALPCGPHGHGRRRLCSSSPCVEIAGESCGCARAFA